jgi:hygromycin-B 7''-O-kinase
MPMLPGRCGQVLWDEADVTARVELAASSGTAPARLHEVAATSCAVYDEQADEFVAVEDDFTTWWLERFDAVRAQCRSVSALSREAEEFIDAVVERDLPALREPFGPVLVHHDLTLGNLNFEPAAAALEPTGVFDLFEAYLGDPEEHLGMIVPRLNVVASGV